MSASNIILALPFLKGFSALCSRVATFRFVEKIKAKSSATAELARLEGMKAKPMKPELKSWLDTRVHLLTKMKGEL